jgi:multiple sugar transport system ATP-binding protein
MKFYHKNQSGKKMAKLELKNIKKSFGDSEILKGIDLEITDGEFVVFVGPSGCGKSTLLRIIAGIESPSSGTIFIENKDVTSDEPIKREIAMVFQSYALYPHLNVFENMAFALKIAKMPKDEIAQKVNQAAKILNIEHLLKHKPKELSGGQRQRVAIGRSIVRNPKIFLFDEPLSNLDAALRNKMRYEFAKISVQLATTIIYVTHDQIEAMTLADKIVVLNNGVISQMGSPMELYQKPQNRFVAQFIGSPKMNFFNAEIIDANHIQLSDGTIIEIKEIGDNLGKIYIGVRPENIIIDNNSNIKARVKFVEHLGGIVYAHLEHKSAKEIVTIQLKHDSSIEINQEIGIKFETGTCHIFNEEGNRI